jgi:hypothetical protein
VLVGRRRLSALITPVVSDWSSPKGCRALSHRHAAGNAFTCASNSSMRSSRPAICAMSPSIRASSDEAGSAVGHDGLDRRLPKTSAA